MEKIYEFVDIAAEISNAAGSWNGGRMGQDSE
jgi:hypothetical protein